MVSWHPLVRVQGDEDTHFALSACIAGGKSSSQQRQVFADPVHTRTVVRNVTVRERETSDYVSQSAREGCASARRAVSPAAF